jgi:hypothetical protein
MKVGDIVIPNDYGNNNSYKEVLVTKVSNDGIYFSGIITVISFVSFEQVVGFKSDAWRQDYFITKPKNLVKQEVTVEITTEKLITVYGIDTDMESAIEKATKNLGNFKVIKIKDKK